MLLLGCVGVKTFQELFAWQLSVRVRDEIVALCETPKLQKDFNFRDQLRDAACGPARLIAEGFGRFTRREFARYLTMARAEMLEVQNHLIDLKAREYVDAAIVDSVMKNAEHATKVIALLRSSLFRD
jgi:four helix bundle protein